MRKNKLMMSGLMALVLGLGISTTALAYRDDFLTTDSSFSSDFQDQVTDVLSNKDYEGWKDLMEERIGDHKVTDVINKDNFNKFVEAWQLAHEGKIREANLIRRELGLGQHQGHR